MKYSFCARITILIIMCNLGIGGLAAMKKEEAPASEQELVTADNLRDYRNLIILMEYGANEILGNSKSLINTMITALKEHCAFILIPAPFWDHFLHSQQVVWDKDTIKDAQSKSSQKIEAVAFFDKDQWEMHKICLKPQEGVEPRKQKADFYLLSPKTYQKQILAHSSIQEIRQKLPEIPEINKLPDLGLDLLRDYLVENPLAERSELGLALDTLQGDARTDEIWRITDESRQQNKLLDCLQQILAFKKAHQALVDLKDKFEAHVDSSEKNKAIENIDTALSLLPRYNVYIEGHGGSSANLPAETATQLQSLMDRAQKLNYWPSGNQLPLLPKMGHLKEATKEAKPPSKKTPQQQAESTKEALVAKEAFLEEHRRFKATREKISSNLRSIAGLQPRFFGEIINFFNGVTNFFFVSTCHGAGIQLALPFVFIHSPQALSYTLVTKALLDAPTSTSIAICKYPDVDHIIDMFTHGLPLKITGNLTYKNQSYAYAVSVSFSRFFNGVSNFPAFIKNEETRIKDLKKIFTPKKNYFARLLNYVANFLDNEGGIRDINNVPWVKLPGNTPWQVVSCIDDQAFFITDVMIRAQQLEKAPTIERQKPLGQILKKKMGKYPEETQPRQQPVPEITIPAHKNLIFVTTNTVPLRVFFEEEKYSYWPIKPKSIIPLGQSFAPGLHVTEFASIATDYDFNMFYKCVLKPVTEDGRSLFKMPENTLFFIKELICKKGTFLREDYQSEYFTLNNCMVFFDVPGFDDYDICFMVNTSCYGIKNGTSKNFTAIKSDDDDIEEIDLNKKLIEAFKRKNKSLVDVLIKAGANAAVLKTKEEPVPKTESAKPELKRVRSAPLQR